jgi:hypothetical protein
LEIQSTVLFAAAFGNPFVSIGGFQNILVTLLAAVEILFNQSIFSLITPPAFG